MEFDEDGTIEGCIAWTHPGAAGTIEAALREQLLAELAELRHKIRAWYRLAAACQPGAVDLTSGEKALLSALMSRAEDG